MKLHAKLALFLLATWFSLLPAHSVRAQGTAFTYQGRLTDGAAPANGLYDLRTSLYDAPASGNLVGTPLTNTAVLVSNGLFTVRLDFGSGIFIGPNRWLEIAVRTNGADAFVALAPLQALTPTPYAIFATTARNVSGTLASSSLAGTYANVLNLNNPANAFSGTFSGNGAALTNVNAATLNGLSIQQNSSGAPNVIGGSLYNFVSAGVIGATIGGGGATNFSGSAFTNSVSATFGTVGGGGRNTAGGYAATVGGGYSNSATGLEATLGGGSQNTASGNQATVGGGIRNAATNYAATVGGGVLNTASGDSATVGGGGGNTANGSSAVVAGGQGNTAGSGSYTTVGGGLGNTASSYSATVAGGYYNTASGLAATVAGGYSNTASGMYSFAAGQYAQGAHQGTFVWADSQNATFTSTANDQFLLRAQGGVGIDTATTVEGGLTLNTLTYLEDHPIYLRGRTGVDHNHGLAYNGGTVTNFGSGNVQIDGPVLWGFGGGALGVASGGPHAVLTWTSSAVAVNGGFSYGSDRHIKSGFRPLDPQQVLEQVAALPLSSWAYTNDLSARHIGPMAQDFHAAFHLDGNDDTHINIGDETGVALAAIQALNQQVQAQAAALKAKEAELARLQQRLERLERLLPSRQ